MLSWLGLISKTAHCTLFELQGMYSKVVSRKLNTRFERWNTSQISCSLQSALQSQQSRVFKVSLIFSLQDKIPLTLTQKALKWIIFKIQEFPGLFAIRTFSPGLHWSHHFTVLTSFNSTVLSVTLKVNAWLKAKWYVILQVTVESTKGLWAAVTQSKTAAIHTNRKIPERTQV